MFNSCVGKAVYAFFSLIDKGDRLDKNLAEVMVRPKDFLKGPTAKAWPYYSAKHIEDETDRKTCKGCHCCLGDGIHSILSRATDLAPG